MRRSGFLFCGLIASAIALPSGIAFAQDGGVRLVFGLENRLDWSRNDSLSVPSEGSTLVNATALSFGLSSETALSRLEFTATGAVLVENSAGTSGTELDFGRTALTFGYHREVPSALFDVTARLRTDEVGAFDEDLGDADEPGTRTDYGLDLLLETGRTSPLGFVFGAGFSATEFEDTVDPDLVDATEGRVNLGAILRFSDVATGRLGVRFSRQEEDFAAVVVTETLGASAGLDYAISERLDLSLELGYVEIDTTSSGITDTMHGPDGRLSLSYEMPNGSATAALSVTTDADVGRRETFEIGRSIELPALTLATRIGVSHSDTTGSDLVGAVDLNIARPDGEIGLSVVRRVGYDTDVSEGFTDTVFSLSAAHRLNDRSGVTLDLSHEIRDAVTEPIEQTEIGVAYNYQLTQDWVLNSGVGYRIRDDASGHAESPNLFISLSRDFEFRP